MFDIFNLTDMFYYKYFQYTQGSLMRLCIAVLLVTLCTGCANQHVWVQDNTRDEVALNSYYSNNRLNSESKNADQKKSGDEFNSAMENKDFTRALEIANRVISQRPEEYDSYQARGDVYIQTKRYKDAISDYNKSIVLGNKKHVVILFRALAFSELGDYDEAIEAINQGLDINNNANFYNLRAYCLNKKGDFDKAIEDGKKAIALDTDNPDFFKNCGLAYNGKGDYEKAMVQFNKSISTDPTYKFAYAGRGETYLKIGNVEGATSDFKKACELGDKGSCMKFKQ